jgi:hypothetical protein
LQKGGGFVVSESLKYFENLKKEVMYRNGKHLIVLQCRANPDQTRFTRAERNIWYRRWWVIGNIVNWISRGDLLSFNSMKDIKPYGLLVHCLEPKKCRCNIFPDPKPSFCSF